MHHKKTTFLSFFFSFCLLVLFNQNGFSQISDSTTQAGKQEHESFENIYIHWFIALDKARITSNISRADFDMFTRFSQKAMDSLRADFMQHIGDKTITTANVGKYESVLINSIHLLYAQYETIRKNYPSSVEEYKNAKSFPSAPCDSACNNINFASGNLSGWNAYYAFNNSSTTANSISNMTGGPAGAVTHAANDLLTSTVGYYNATVGPNQSPDYQINITSGSRGDAIIPTVPVVSPFGGQYSVMLGDSTQVNYGVAILSQTFQVTPTNDNFTYQYAVFLANPLHNYYQQPFFRVALLDQLGDTIPYCGDYNVVSGNGTQTFDSIVYTDTALNETYTVYYKNWTIVAVPLKNYMGQCVTIVFESGDCALGGHFGYAYVDASCSPGAIISSSPNLCGQDSISLTAPPGYATYKWTGPNHGILGSPTTQTIWVDSSGAYRVILVPVTGLACADTLYDTIGIAPGPVPKPDFSTTVGCAGQALHFINTSTDTATANFYWDFYNIGFYNDSNIVNPYWTYSTPGTYMVKLVEINNGCGADTTITIKIDSSVIGGFTAAGGCLGTTVITTNSSTGATSYLWNYGDPGSGTHDTSSATNGSHNYTLPGTYTITLIAKNSGSCPDTVKQVITISPIPVPVITGFDSICPSYNDILTVTGGTTYLWSTGATTSSISTAPSATETVTVTASNGSCIRDTSFTIRVVSPAATITTPHDSVCLGDSTILYAGGGLTYRWSNNSTKTSIFVRPAATTTYTLYTTFGACTDSATITVHISPATSFSISATKDSICPGNTTVISITSPGGPNYKYKWSTGATTSSISVSPAATITYTVEVNNGYCPKDTSISIFVKIAPVLTVTSPIDTICLGQSVSLSVSGASSYTWAPSAGLSCITCPNPTATPTATVTYLVIGRDTDGCTSAKNAFILVETIPVLGFIPNQSICSGNEVTLTATELSGVQGGYLWQPGGSTSTTINIFPDTTTTYTVQYANKCGVTDTTTTVFVNPSPTPQFTASITTGCAPLCLQFYDKSTILGGTIVQWGWKFGDGDTSFVQNPIYCYPDTGTFTPTLSVVSADGCESALQIDQMITVYSKPVASFIYSPNPINTVLEPTVVFTDKSTDAYGIAYWSWIFGDGSVNTSENSIENPTHDYPDTGAYCPTLIVTNTKGCIDTITECLAVIPLYTLYIPSAFSPNGDGDNDFFAPKGAYIKSFEMYIFDRWGMELYHTTDIHDGWDGRVRSSGKICQEDSYVYKITAVDWSNKQHSYVGEVTLIK